MKQEAVLNLFKQRIAYAQKKPIRNFLKIRKLKSQLQAFESEGGHDIMSTYITAIQDSYGVVDKNNYKTYGKQVDGAYRMFMSQSDYGSEILRSVVETRVALIGGEGLSVTAENKKTQEWIDSFLDSNRLKGSRLLSIIQTGELEGRNLLVLNRAQKNKEEQYVSVIQTPWYQNNYTVEKADTYDGVKKIYYSDENNMEKIIPTSRAVYIQIGGTDCHFMEPTSRLHCVLTDCENYSRAKYDLRKNGFLFGRVTPTWKLEANDPGANTEATAIRNALDSFDWEPGRGYAGKAEFDYKTPGSGAQDLLLADALSSLRNIATTLSIPIHFLSHPELMSNRATADNLLELVNLGTKKDRLIYEESFTEMIEKARVFAIDNGMAKAEILGDFEIKLPLISLAMLKNLIEVWFPLVDNVVSMATFRNMLPGIDPAQEVKQLEREKKDAIKKAQENPLFNKTGGLNDNGQEGITNNNADTGSGPGSGRSGDVD